MTAGRSRWLSRQSAVDVVLAASTAALDLLLFSTISSHRPADAWPTVAIGVAGFAALVVRRRYPVPVFAVVWLCAVLAAPLSGMDYRPTATPCVALFTVALHTRTRVAVMTLVTCAVPAVTASLLEAASRSGGEAVVALYATLAFNLMLYGCVWAGGRWARLSRQHAEDLEFRRRVEAQEAVLGERTRIARELHDIVAHSVTVMVLQAAGARRVLDSDAARVRQALGHIEESGEQAMGELRRMLIALRLSCDDGGPDCDTSRPQPGLADVDHLVATIAAAGVRVHSRVDGPPRRLAASVDLAAYRVVQEALTNVTKHVGPGASVDVRLVWADDELTVRVTDDGCGRRPDRTLSTNHGLVGLRERLAIVGGRLEADPVPAGGFRVTAVLPVAGRAVGEVVGDRR